MGNKSITQTSDKSRKIVEWSVDRIESHPDNRPVNVRSPRYAEIRDSIRDNGIQQPLIVRQAPGLSNPARVQCLCGHHRLAAARELGLATVPVDHRGELADAAAFDVMAISNLHIPLTPLEEGQRAARWLDVYGQDAQVVAGKLGQTPRWVVEHAQIYRGLTAEWQKAAGDNPYFDRWTSSHWAVIAKLPATLQGQLLGRFTNGAFCSYDRWSVKELEDRIGHKTFLLAKAPFPRESCAACPNRTGQQPLFLWSDTAEGATGDRERCLDAKCWKRKCEKAERKAFQTIAEAKGLDNAVPLCLLKPPKDGWGRERDEYNKAVSACRRTHKGLVLSDRVKVVKETTPGAVPAIVVAGVSKGSVKWVKVQEAEAGESGREARGPRPPTAKELAKQKEEDRWSRVLDRVTERICASPAPSAAGILYLMLFMEGPDLYGAEWHKTLDRIVQLSKAIGGQEFEDELCDSLWAEMTKGGPRRIHWVQDVTTTLDVVCPLFDIDPKAIYAELEAEDARAEASQTRTEVVTLDLPKKFRASCELRSLQEGDKWFGGFRLSIPKAQADLPVATDGDGYATKGECVQAMAEACAKQLTEWKKQGKGTKALYVQIALAIGEVVGACELERARKGTVGKGVTPGVCRVCGCTDDDCSQCIEATGEPCTWVEPDLCSRCAQQLGKGVVAAGGLSDERRGPSDEGRATSDATTAKPSGLIECPERIRVPMDQAWQAAVTIKIAQVANQWYVGWDAHVPGAGACTPCSTAHRGYRFYGEALMFAVARLTAWLDGQPGRKGYKHYDAIKEAVGRAVTAAMAACAAEALEVDSNWADVFPAGVAAEPARPKRGRPVGSKDKTKRKTRGAAAGVSSDERRGPSDERRGNPSNHPSSMENGVTNHGQ